MNGLMELRLISLSEGLSYLSVSHACVYGLDRIAPAEIALGCACLEALGTPQLVLTKSMVTDAMDTDSLAGVDPVVDLHPSLR